MSERLFFALWPPEAVREAVARRVRGVELAGRPVPPENWHITLAFLGNVAAERRRRYERAAAAVRAAPFKLCLDRVGFFPRSRIAWLGASHLPAPLEELHGALTERLAGAGFEPERRPFRPHLTLARKAAPKGAPVDIEPVVWPVTGFRLVRSETRPDGARYHKAAVFMLTR